MKQETIRRALLVLFGAALVGSLGYGILEISSHRRDADPRDIPIDAITDLDEDNP